MTTRDEILSRTYDKWKEYIEMYPGREGEILAGLLASELEREIDQNEYYKRLIYARISTKH